jgi:hypothetical protein
VIMCCGGTILHRALLFPKAILTLFSYDIFQCLQYLYHFINLIRMIEDLLRVYRKVEFGH